MKTVEFGTLFRFIRNGMNVKQDKSGEGLPITRIETISDATVDGTRVGFAGLAEADCKDWLLQTGDILFSHINSVDHIGKCAVYRGVPTKLVHGMNLLCLRSDTTKLLPEFAKYLIRGTEFRTRLSNFINKAVNQASISIGNLKTIPVTVPRLAEQRRIAEVLDRAEALRAKRRAALAQLHFLTQSVFPNLFANSNAPARKIGDLLKSGTLKLHKDGNHGSLYPGADDFGSEGVPFLMAKCIADDGRINNALIARLHEDKARKLRIGWILKGDILLAHNASVGKVALYDGRFAKALIGTSLTAFRPNSEELDSQYLAAALRSADFQRQLAKNMGQTTRNQVPITAQRGLSLRVPPLKLQREYARRVAAVEELKSVHCTSLAELDALFATLQYRAFRGEL